MPRFPHDPTTAQRAPNGATVYASPRGARGARIDACPVVGHARPLTVYALDRDGRRGCTRIRGRYVAGDLAWTTDGPTLTGFPGSNRAEARPAAPACGKTLCCDAAIPTNALG